MTFLPAWMEVEVLTGPPEPDCWLKMSIDARYVFAIQDAVHRGKVPGAESMCVVVTPNANYVVRGCRSWIQECVNRAIEDSGREDHSRIT